MIEATHHVAPVTISVAMATFNGARFLRAQLDTLAAQSHRPSELVINDDCSTDDTLAVLEDFAGRAPFPMRIERNATRLGWRGNFLAAATRCTGDLVAFCDQDDTWRFDKLAIVAPLFDDPEVLLVFHNADLVDVDGRPYGTLATIATSVKRIARLSRPTPWSNPLGLVQVFRRDLLRFADLWATSVDVYAPAHRAAHDQWFYHWATNLGDVVALPQRLLAYRQHGANAVGWFHEKTAFVTDRRQTLDELDRMISMLVAFVGSLETALVREPSLAIRKRLEAATRRNRTLLERLEGRRAMYHARGAWRRAVSVGRLLVEGAYGGDGWTLGRRALVRDVLTGVPFGAPDSVTRANEAT